MSARASKRRHEGRAIRKRRRLQREYMQNPNRLIADMAAVTKAVTEAFSSMAIHITTAFFEFGRAFLAQPPGHQRDYALVPPPAPPVDMVIVGGFNNEPGIPKPSPRHRIASWDDSLIEYRPLDED